MFSREDTSISQTHSPEAKIWSQLSLPLLTHRFFPNAHIPFLAGPHIHLPVMAARSEQRESQDTSCMAESLRLGPFLLLEKPTIDSFQVLRNDEVLVGSVNIQGHIHLELLYPWVHLEDSPQLGP